MPGNPRRWHRLAALGRGLSRDIWRGFKGFSLAHVISHTRLHICSRLYMHLQVSRVVILPLLPAAVEAGEAQVASTSPPFPKHGATPISYQFMCPDPRLHRAVSFIPCSPTFASLPSLKHRRLLPPCSRTALAASTRNSSQKPRWRQMTGNCWEPAWVPAWEFAAGREGTARGRGRCFGGCLPSPLSVAGLFFTGKKNHQSLEALVQFLPWVSWSYRCFQTSWWFGLQPFGLMAVYLSNRCRTSMLELGVFFFFLGWWYAMGICNPISCWEVAVKSISSTWSWGEINWNSSSYTSLLRGSTYPGTALHTAQYKNHKRPESIMRVHCDLFCNPVTYFCSMKSVCDNVACQCQQVGHTCGCVVLRYCDIGWVSDLMHFYLRYFHLLGFYLSMIK